MRHARVTRLEGQCARWFGSKTTRTHLYIHPAKSLLNPLNYGVVYFTLQTMKRPNLPSEFCKTGQITLSSGLGGDFATVTAGLLQ
jgi:hypothetical protein